MTAVPPHPRDVAILDGVLERVTFANPERGYTIARIAPTAAPAAGRSAPRPSWQGRAEQVGWGRWRAVNPGDDDDE